MRILITTDVYSTVTSGVTVSVKNLYEELKRLGHSVRLITPSDRLKSYVDGDVTYIRSVPLPIYKGIRMPISYRHPLIKDIIRWRPDVIHSQCEFFTYQYALYISKRTGAPILHTYHTMYEDYANYIIPGKKIGDYAVRKFLRYRLRGAKRVIAPSEKIEKRLKNYSITPPISIVPSGIELKDSKGHNKSIRGKVRGRVGVDEDVFLLIYLGRLGHEKNLCEIISYFAAAVKKMPEIALMIVGEGPQKDELLGMVNEYKITDKIFFTGKVRHEEVADYYQSCDLFVSASKSETQGLTYIEACANGLPLLCRRDDCLKGVIYEGENGYTYENEEEFISHLKKIKDNPKWRKNASQKSRKIAESFSKEGFARAVEKIYNETI